MDLGLTGHACVVTGASRGIGFATAQALAAEGAHVLLVARGAERLEQAAGELGAGHATCAADVTDPEAPERILAAAHDAFGRLDALVNNAGTSADKPLDELTEEDWQLQWDLHVMASMRLMRAAAPRMAENPDGGRIVNVCSSSGKRPSLRNPAYGVTKSAQFMLSRLFADTWAPRGVLVNAVSPGPVASELWTGADGLAAQIAERRGTTPQEVLDQVAAGVPVGRLAEEGEIAAVIAFLCSARASNVAGAAWSVDGGAAPMFI